MRILLTSVVILGLIAAIYRLSNDFNEGLGVSQVVSAAVKPGKLSKFHAHLEENCTTCHAQYQGVNRTSCVMCHADNSILLKKENTAFHGSISSCTGCHFEHSGRQSSITKMDHVRLFDILAKYSEKNSQHNQKGKGLENKVISNRHSQIDPEKALNCQGCHGNQDKHRGLFGTSCSECHDFQSWKISSFKHPSPSSKDCSQCHQAPPSHYMMHFQMVSEKVAGVEHARVQDCFSCHNTNSWNDIRDVGWYKHH